LKNPRRYGGDEVVKWEDMHVGYVDTPVFLYLNLSNRHTTSRRHCFDIILTFRCPNDVVLAYYAGLNLSTLLDIWRKQNYLLLYVCTVN